MIRKLLTTKEAAAQLGVGESFLVKDRFYGGGIPFVRLGHRSIRYRQEDLDSHVVANVHASTSSCSQALQPTPA